MNNATPMPTQNLQQATPAGSPVCVTTTGQAGIQLNLSNLSCPQNCIAEMNRRYAVVQFGGKAFVIDEGSAEFTLISSSDFKQFYVNVQVPVGNNAWRPLGEYWLKHARRRQYLDGVVFAPEQSIMSSQYNLWQGYAVTADPRADCSKFLSHLKEVICSGVDEHYEYCLNWLAMMIQRPWQLPETAIVLLSGQGTGKGMIVEYVGRLLQRHYKHITNKDHIVGTFTGHLQDAVLVFADELCWEGSKSDAGALKGLITEGERMMERKYAEATKVKNCVHLVVASNEAWAVPAETSDRRFFVLDVSNHRQGDRMYFSALAQEMEGSGPSGLLAHLQTRNINTFDSREFPKTTARLQQQLRSLDEADQWIHEFLINGSVSPEAQWASRIVKLTALEAFRTWRTRNGVRNAVVSHAIIAPALKKYGVTTGKTTAKGGKQRQNCYVFPTLKDMRAAFENNLGHAIGWQ